jgi:hypothetical protein
MMVHAIPLNLQCPPPTRTGKEATMLVIVSDLHLTDGTESPSLSAGAMQLFAERLNDLAERASWRVDGKYRPLERIDLVLLGDTIDLLRTAWWQQTPARPWDDSGSNGVIESVRRVVDGVLAHNTTTLEHLRSLVTHGGVALAPSSGSGQPVFGAELLAVPVHVHYMVGNHDWLLHLEGPEYEAIRRKVVSHLGLAHDARQPFAHEPADSGSLQEVFRRHRVMARHGDVFDPLNFYEDRRTSSVGDVLVIELVNRFIQQLQQQLGADLPQAVLASLRELDHVRPLLLAPVWLAGLLERACPSATMRREVKRCWDQQVERLLQLGAIRDLTSSPNEMIDGLQRALLFNRQTTPQWGARINQWLDELRGGDGASYWKQAIVEPEFRNRRAKYVVYGHTHQTETLPLDASCADGFALQQMYFNTGTWRRFYQPTRWEPAEHEFIGTESMTYLTFFAGDERGGRPFESWSGTLAALTPVSATYRLDTGRTTSHASQEPVPTSTVPLARPHFAVSPAAARASSAVRH